MRKQRKTRAVRTHLVGLFVVILGLSAQGGLAATGSNSAPSPNPVLFLTGPNSGSPLAIARRYIQQNKQELRLSSVDIADVVVTDQYTSSHNGVTHIYLRQRHQGLEVHNANININIARDGSVINLGNRFMPGIDKAINTTAPSLSFGAAISAAARSLGIDPGQGNISRRPIPKKLVFQPVADNLARLAWDLEIYELDAQNWWSLRIDAISGAVLDQINYVARENYNVYPLPVESPNHGSRSVVSMPADPVASISGWVETQCTRGNNVDAYVDADNSNRPTNDDGSRACDAGLNFSFPLDLAEEPGQYQDAAVTNLFYWNNIIHDVFYQYGFDEVSGNFQDDNYALGGAGGDAVFAEAQDGGGTNNANFATPPDGTNPRMQMYLWDHTIPQHDGDFDNGIIVHEYGHGISTRLTGGPGTSACLSNSEQAGEGWSDFFGLWTTMESGDSPSDVRGVGTYALGQATDGPGIRDYPYSTDMAIDPRTYAEIKTATVPHGVGSTWAAMLWEMIWALIGEYGFDADPYRGMGGNNIALQLVVDGLKLQPCSPGFVDSRDAILLADLNNNAGANQCLIWDAFAKRGLGYSANQGSSASRTDGTQAFDVPPVCQNILALVKTASPSPIQPGQILTYSLQVDNRTLGTLSNVTLTDTVPVHTSYVADSTTCGGVETGGEITFALGTLNSGDRATCTFDVTVSPATGIEVVSDDMEGTTALWAQSHGAGNIDWSLSTGNSHTPFNAWFAQDLDSSTDQYLTMINPAAITGDAVLRFWHSYDTEANWDGGVVEISVNGGAWTDLGPLMFQNGYNSTIITNLASAISDRDAFSGNSSGFIETAVDLSSYANNNAQIRFRMATDGFIGGVGWYVDDVAIVDDALLFNEACVTAAEGDSDCESVNTMVMPVTGPPAPSIAVNPESLSSSQDQGDVSIQTLNIGNNGNAVLDWDIMTDSAGSCAAPDNGVLWASAQPLSGAVSPAGSTAVQVSFDASGLAPDVYTGALCVISTDTTNSPFVVNLSMAVSDPTATQDRVATGESLVKGVVVAGTYLDTQVDDGIIEIIGELHQGGKRADRHDALEQIWIFDLQSGSGVTFNANVWGTAPGSDGEQWAFSYSSDNVNYTWFHTLTSTASNNVITQQYLDQSPGPFYIKVEDTDRTKGHNNNGRVYVDYLAITEGGTTLPPTTITMKVSSLTDESEASNRRNRWDAIVGITVVDKDVPSNAVTGAVVTGSWSNGTNGSGSCTTNSTGQCSIVKPNLKQSVSEVTFTVNDVSRGLDSYDPSASVTMRTLTAP
jgi:extracellular elastinolytic metalloproteinase